MSQIQVPTRHPIVATFTMVTILFVWNNISPTSSLNSWSRPESPVSLDTLYHGLNHAETVIAFYRSRQGTPAWFTTLNQTRLTDSLILFIRNARYYGLNPHQYHLRDIQSTDARRKTMRGDILFTDAFFSLAHDLSRGRLLRVAAEVDSLHIQILNELLEKGGLKKALTNLEPRSTGYQSLKAGLKFLLDSLSGRQKESLIKGLTTDTLESNKTIKVIELNLNRWRKEKTDWGDRYLFINIPSFMATLVSDGGVALRSKVIVGKPSTPTPELSSEIQCFITYPYWHVTKKIASEEFLPFIKKDVSFLRKNNLDVLDRKGRILDPDSIQWSRFSTEYFPVTLRQREGPENALGVLKFVFDNPYQVFLHDTNTPRLFQSKVRTFSHGCIRMEKARELAHYLLTGSTDARSPILERYMQRKIRHTMNLEHPVSIYVRYITAEYNDQQLFIYNDIYNKDRPLIKRLYGSSAR